MSSDTEAVMLRMREISMFQQEKKIFIQY